MAGRTWRHYALLLLFIAIAVIGIQLLVITSFVHLPNFKRGISSTDTLIIGDISTIWCKTQVIEAPYPLTIYATDKRPSIGWNNVTEHNFRLTKKMGWSDFVYFRAFLLSGSTITVSSCSSDPGAYIYLVKGGESFDQCLTRSAQEHDLTQDSLESREEMDSIEMAEKVRKTAAMKNRMRASSFFANCPHSLIDRENILALESLQNDTLTACTDDSTVVVQTNETTTGYYYAIIDNYFYGGINNIEMNITLRRTHFDLGAATPICKHRETCDVPLTFASREELVIKAPASPYHSRPLMFHVSSTCRQRVSFYLVLFILLPLIFGLLVVCLYKALMGKNLVQKRLIIPGTDNTDKVWFGLETSKAPLLFKRRFKWPNYTCLFTNATSRKERLLHKNDPFLRSSRDGFAPLEVRMDPSDTLPSYDDVVVFDRSHIVNKQIETPK